MEKNQILRERKTKSVVNGNKLFKEKGNYKNSLENSFDKVDRSVAYEEDGFDEGMPHRKAELIELYQKLYEQFTKQKIKTMHTKSRIQGKFSKGVIP